jgi:hypothetical protein
VRTLLSRKNKVLTSHYKEETFSATDKMKRKSDDSKKSRAVWSAAEDDTLLKAVLEDQQDREAEGDGDEDEDWDDISKSVPGKSPVLCLKRYMSLNKKGQAGAPTEPTSPVEAEKEEDTTESPEAKKPKRGKKEADSSAKWSASEIELLKKLVDQYKDSA